MTQSFAAVLPNVLMHCAFEAKAGGDTRRGPCARLKFFIDGRSDVLRPSGLHKKSVLQIRSVSNQIRSASPALSRVSRAVEQIMPSSRSGQRCGTLVLQRAIN